jgi:hypothetical protein
MLHQFNFPGNPGTPRRLSKPAPHSPNLTGGIHADPVLLRVLHNNPDLRKAIQEALHNDRNSR